MSTALDDSLVPKVAELINTKVGTDAVFFEVASQSYDTRTGEVAASEPTQRTAKIAPPFKKTSFKDGQLVQSSHFESVLAAQGLAWTPVNGMKVTHGGLTYRLTEATPIYSGDLVCAFMLKLEGGS